MNPSVIRGIKLQVFRREVSCYITGFGTSQLTLKYPPFLWTTDSEEAKVEIDFSELSVKSEMAQSAKR